MRTKLLITITFVLATTFSQAQSKSEIQNIRKIYYQVKEAITYSKKHKFEGKLYCNTTEENVNGASWRAVGNYHTKINYWYDDDPSIDESRDPRSCLRMVIENSKISDGEYYIEYLFGDGKLIFVYYKSKTNEIRFYVKNNKQIKMLGEFKDDKYVWNQIIGNANRYMKVFLANFGL